MSLESNDLMEHLVYEILQKLLHRFHWIVPGYIMGGENKSKEKARFYYLQFLGYLFPLSNKKSFPGISVLVATPGRLLDHLKNTKSFVYSKLRWIIFDEADRYKLCSLFQEILELGYGKDIEEILTLLGSKQSGSISMDALPRPTDNQRQNLLLSATLNEKVNHLANISLENPTMIGLDDKKISSGLLARSTKKISAGLLSHSDRNMGTVGSDRIEESRHSDMLAGCSNEEYKIPAQLVQRYVKVSCGSRLVALLSILRTLFEKEANQKFNRNILPIVDKHAGNAVMANAPLLHLFDAPSLIDQLEAIVVFFSTCDAVDFHYSLISEFQWLNDSEPVVNQKRTFVRCRPFHLHGNMARDDRRSSFQGFNGEKSALLLCTDVAARGLDFPKVRCIIQYDSPGEATEYVHRVGRTARLGKKGDALLFLQPVEMDYRQHLQKHGVSLTEFPLLKVFNSFPLFSLKQHSKKPLSLEMHPCVSSLQKALESFVSSEVNNGNAIMRLKNLAQETFRSWVGAYAAHRGELKKIFVVKRLHLGHVARSFGLKEQPTSVGRSFHSKTKKRKREHKQNRPMKRKKGTDEEPTAVLHEAQRWVDDAVTCGMRVTIDGCGGNGSHSNDGTRDCSKAGLWMLDIVTILCIRDAQ
ncbi:hypothetical protein ACLOJK_025214 [Asimina triloba]